MRRRKIVGRPRKIEAFEMSLREGELVSNAVFDFTSGRKSMGFDVTSKLTAPSLNENFLRRIGIDFFRLFVFFQKERRSCDGYFSNIF